MPEIDMPLRLSQPLRVLVSNKFDQAKASKSLLFSDTQLAIIHSKLGIPFQLRYCPALSKKPTSNPASNTSQTTAPSKKEADPFENPSFNLLVGRLPSSHADDNHGGPNQIYTHNLVLNKYPVIPNHFILSTRENKAQTNLLEADDLFLTYACIQAWNDEDNDQELHQLYAFFNTGPHSGASQPHRHLQFLPVEDMRGSSPSLSTSSDSWGLLCNTMTTPLPSRQRFSYPLFHNPDIPVVHLATPLESSLTPAQLHERYILLVRAAGVLIAQPSSSSSSTSPAELFSNLTTDSLASILSSTAPGTKAPFSYNLALTSRTLAILPRRAEAAVFPISVSTTIQRQTSCTDPGATSTLSNSSTGNGSVALNGTILAGTMMVKEAGEWDALRFAVADQGGTGTTGVGIGVDEILEQIGFPWRGADAVEGTGGMGRL